MGSVDQPQSRNSGATPRTDALIAELHPDPLCALIDLGRLTRQLERELSATRSEQGSIERKRIAFLTELAKGSVNHGIIVPKELYERPER